LTFCSLWGSLIRKIAVSIIKINWEYVYMGVEEFFKQEEERFIRDNLMSDEVLDFIRENTLPFNQLMAYYRCAIMEVETKFKVLNEQFSLQYDRNQIESIKTRIKSTEGIIKKANKKKIPFTMQAIEENIRDIAGIRVICSFSEDIYMLADCLLKQDDIRLVEMKDYIKHPKESGYRSLHVIIEIPIFLQNEKGYMKVEVQLRTIAMDFWASVEHKLRYKKNIPDSEAETLAVELSSYADQLAELDNKMEQIKKRIVEAEKQAEPAGERKRPITTIGSTIIKNRLNGLIK
jgi:putative GTP pyrophosphokinase